MSGLVGDLWRPDAGLVEMKSGGFVDDVDCMGRWPSYGGSDVAMGEWPAYGDLSKRMGRCVRRVAVWENRENVWGNGLCGMPLNRMGSHENVWEIPQDMGNGAGIWGGRQAVWGAKIALKTRNMGTVAACGLCMFSEIFVGTAVLWEAVEMYGDPVKHGNA